MLTGIRGHINKLFGAARDRPCLAPIVLRLARLHLIRLFALSITHLSLLLLLLVLSLLQAGAFTTRIVVVQLCNWTVLFIVVGESPFRT